MAASASTSEVLATRTNQQRLWRPVVGGAGNCIVFDHGGGWTTYYFHLASFSVADGQQVTQGQQIGLTGSTGRSSSPHIHYEQLFDGVGQTIKIRGQLLAPYPDTYGLEGAHEQGRLLTKIEQQGKAARCWRDAAEPL